MHYSSSEFLSLAIQAALQAGDILRKGFGTRFEIEKKPGRHNLVTFYDKSCEAAIISSISKRFPSHGFLGEEQGLIQKSDIMWILDPLDGTLNFVHGIPIFCVSIAVAVEKQLVASCVYQPMTQELFWAEKGAGSFLNGKPITVSTTKRFDEAFLACGFPYHIETNPDYCIEKLSAILRKGIPFRRLGAAAMDLAYIAAGRLDAFWGIELQPWDFAAGALLIEEGKGQVTNHRFKFPDILNPGPLVATNRFLHEEIMEFIQ